MRVRRSDFLATASATALLPRLPAAVQPRYSTGARTATLRLDALPSGHDLHPYRDQERGVEEIAWLYADGLVGWNGGPVPLLAATLPAVSEGGLRYRYRLRDARWHDGEPVLAQDVAAAFDSIRNLFWGTFKPYRSVRAVEPTGRLTFDVVLREPVTGFASGFFGAYGTLALPLLRTSPDALPVGTGPFAVHEKLDFNRWRLERSDASPRGRARLDRIDLRYQSSRDTEYVAMRKGEVDVALPLPGRFPDVSGYRRVLRTTGTTLLTFNAEGPFGDVRARRALARLIDVEAVQRDYDPHRTALLASLRVDGPNDAQLERALAHDARAGADLKRLLGARKVRIITVPGTTVDVAMTLVRQALVGAHIEVQMLATPYNGLFAPSSPLRSGDFDLALRSYVTIDADDLAADWSCASRAPNGGNFARWCDPVLDRLMAAGERDDAEARLSQELAAIPMSRAYEAIGVADGVCAFPAPPAFVPATYACTSWRLC